MLTVVAWALVTLALGYVWGAHQGRKEAEAEAADAEPAAPQPTFTLETDLEILEIYNDPRPILDGSAEATEPGAVQSEMVERTAKVRKRSTGEVRLIRLVVPD